MNMQNQSNPQTDLNRILEIISKIGRLSADGDYIYRGEPKCYKKVSSNLYRKLEDIGIEHPEKIVEEVQKAELEEAKEYIDEEDELEILTQIQHFGGKTNLIDFTTDYNVALFFACDGFPDEPGRIILQDKTRAIKDWIREPQNPVLGSRPDVQKSIFVRPPEGFIGPDKTLDIPKDLKRPLLKYLETEFKKSAKKIYYDIYGFIRSQGIRWEAYTEYSRGITYQNKRDEVDQSQEKAQYNQKAIKHFTTAIQLNPDFAETYKNRGVAYNIEGAYDRAIKDYNMVIKLQPNDADAYNNRGDTYRNKRNHNQAVEDFSTAIMLNPQLAEAYNNRGVAYSDKGKYGDAIADFDKAIELNPNYANAYTNRGLAYCREGKSDRAIEDFNKVIDLKPNSADAYTNRGLGYSGSGKYSNAIEDFDKATDFKPNSTDAYLGRGIAYSQAGKSDRAIEDFNKTIQLNPNFTDAYCGRGLAYSDKGEYGSAIEDFNKAIDLKPDVADAYYNRGEAWLHLGEWEKAREDLTVAVAMGINIINVFCNDYASVGDFEQRNEVKLPADLAAMLTP